jgi:hypothetical protein
LNYAYHSNRQYPGAASSGPEVIGWKMEMEEVIYKALRKEKKSGNFSRHSEKILTVKITENVEWGHSHQAPM